MWSWRRREQGLARLLPRAVIAAIGRRDEAVQSQHFCSFKALEIFFLYDKQQITRHSFERV